MTFDDGPDPRYTPQVLALLREYDVKATFCVVGENAQDHPDLIQAIVADGHTLCNHSWHHDVTLGNRSADQIRADLLRTNEAIRAAVPDAPIVWYRQPGGAWTYPVVSVAQQLGMTPLHWSVDPSDWQVPGAAKIAATVLSQAEPGVGGAHARRRRGPAGHGGRAPPDPARPDAGGSSWRHCPPTRREAVTSVVGRPPLAATGLRGDGPARRWACGAMGLRAAGGPLRLWS